jgi:hypothetical protein
VNCAFPTFTIVPAGYRLVIENVSGWFNLQMNSTPISGYLENFHLPNHGPDSTANPSQVSTKMCTPFSMPANSPSSSSMEIS